MTAAVTGPGLARAVASDCTETLRKAISGIAMLSREVVRLKAELRDRDEKIAERDGHIRELQALIFRGTL